MHVGRLFVAVSVLSLGWLCPSGLYAQVYEDDFDRADGPVDGWTVNNGAWNIVGGELIGGPPAGAEQECFAGDPVVTLPENYRLSFDIRWIAPDPPGGIGRHAGVMFSFDQVAARGGGSGYLVWWIDRAGDKGFNLARRDAGGFNHIVVGPGADAAPADPPTRWEIEVTEKRIRVYGDGELFIDHVDSTYRQGHFAFWTWSGEGQTVAYDNVTVEEVVCDACFEVTTPGPFIEGDTISFEATCSLGADTFMWDFGDGNTAVGASVDHSYATGGDYAVTLSAEGAECADTLSQEVSVVGLVPYDCAASFAEDTFERDDLGDWTVHAGTWNVVDGKLVGGPATGGGQAGEQQIFLGNPPKPIRAGDAVISFDWNFLAPADSQPVGRHAGCFFGWNEPGIRWAGNTTGYQLWWIDRASDRGLNLAVWNPGLGAVLQAGTFGLFSDPPTNIRIEIEGDNIRVYGDDILAFDVVDSTFRGGLFGLWTWDGAGNHVEFDNVCIDGESVLVDAAFDVATAPPLLVGEPVTFDASSTFGDAPTFTWDFGDGEMGEGMVVDHAFADPGTFTVQLTAEVGGQVDTEARDVTIVPCLTDYQADFEGADGPVEDWTVFVGPTWAQAGGKLIAGPTAEEYFIWAGDPPLITAPDAIFEFDHTFLSPGSNAAIGRHGGFQFHCNRPTRRSGGAEPFSGYLVDWIDRASDRGVRLTRVDNGGFAAPVLGEPVPDDPPVHYRIEIDGDNIRVFGDDDIDGDPADDVLYIDAVDSTYRGGHFGYWTWVGDQEIEVDNVTVTANPLVACLTVAPDVIQIGTTVSFDASCSKVFCGGTVDTFTWDFGDGSTANGPIVEHTFDSAETFTVSLTITDGAGATATLDREVVVTSEFVPFADCFDERNPLTDLDGDGWTVPLGSWATSLARRAQTTTTTGAPDAESWLWVGSPAQTTTDTGFVAEFDVPSVAFNGDPADGVQRHFGVMFYSNVVTTNRTSPESNGYALWWIDRESDRGFSMTRLDGSTRNFLASGVAGDMLDDPPTHWRIEVDGPNIRFYGSDTNGQKGPVNETLYIDVEDDTYRAGHFGFWAWKNMDVQIDNVLLGAGATCAAEPVFRRGDTDGNGSLDVTDPINNLSFQFLGTFTPPCRDAADFDDNGKIEVTDPIANLSHQFLGQAPPPAPGKTDCGPDPTDDDGNGNGTPGEPDDDLGCEQYPAEGAGPEAACN